MPYRPAISKIEEDEKEEGSQYLLSENCLERANTSPMLSGQTPLSFEKKREILRQMSKHIDLVLQDRKYNIVKLLQRDQTNDFEQILLNNDVSGRFIKRERQSKGDSDPICLALKENDEQSCSTLDGRGPSGVYVQTDSVISSMALENCINQLQDDLDLTLEMVYLNQKTVLKQNILEAYARIRSHVTQLQKTFSHTISEERVNRDNHIATILGKLRQDYQKYTEQTMNHLSAKLLGKKMEKLNKLQKGKQLLQQRQEEYERMAFKASKLHLLFLKLKLEDEQMSPDFDPKIGEIRTVYQQNISDTMAVIDDLSTQLSIMKLYDTALTSRIVPEEVAPKKEDPVRIPTPKEAITPTPVAAPASQITTVIPPETIPDEKPQSPIDDAIRLFKEQHSEDMGKIKEYRERVCRHWYVYLNCRTRKIAAATKILNPVDVQKPLALQTKLLNMALYLRTKKSN
jgi:hypothetical protein